MTLMLFIGTGKGTNLSVELMHCHAELIHQIMWWDKGGLAVLLVHL